MRDVHLRSEEPDVAALQESMPEAEQRADQQDRPECACLVQVLSHTKLLHIIGAQRLLYQRVQDLQDNKELHRKCFKASLRGSVCLVDWDLQSFRPERYKATMEDAARHRDTMGWQSHMLTSGESCAL